MLIDWFTVVAQAINFIVLVWLMKRFLYGPVLRAIDARETKIAAELADADAQRSQAKQERADLASKNADFDRHRAGLISKATTEAQSLRQRLIEEARQEVDELTVKRQQAMKADARHSKQALLQRVQKEVFAIARKTLVDLTGAGLEERMSETFIVRLREISGASKTDLVDARKSSAEPAIVRSAFALPDEQREPIQQAINETFEAEVSLRFETTPKLVSGIELTIGGKKLAWSIADYLTSLEAGVSELLHLDESPETDLNTELKTESTMGRETDPRAVSHS